MKTVLELGLAAKEAAKTVKTASTKEKNLALSCIAEALLKNMEQKTGCVQRDQRCRRVIAQILEAAKQLNEIENLQVSTAAQSIISAAQSLEE